MRDALKPSTGWSGLLLLTAMLLVVAWSVEAASWAEGLGILTGAVLGGVAASLVLAKLPWMPSSLAHAWALVLGFLWTLLLGTRVVGQYFPETDFTAMPAMTQMAAVRDIVAGWVIAVRAGSSAEASAFVFVLATAFLVWLLTYVSVRFLVKYASFWGSVLPAGVALVANLYYAKDAPAAHLALFLLCSLLLAALTSVAVNEEYWREARIPYSPDIGLDFLKDGAVIAIAVLVIGWMAPAEVRSAPLTSVVSTVAGASGDLQGRFNRLFPDINYPARGSGGAYTDSMPLSGAISLGTMPIFDARIEGDLVPRYWRMAVFDTYDGSGWRRAETSVTEVNEGYFGAQPAYTVPVTQTIETLQPTTNQLVSASQPSAFSIPVRAHFGAGEAAGGLMAAEPRSPLPVGSSYEAFSDVAVVDRATLRASGDDDPEWIRQRYLALPPATPELDQVAAQAWEVVADAGNRYDKADRLENWLRQFPYTEEIGTPPEGRDRVHWFLFDERQGYCDYYSSAFVVMARYVGVPARIAAGYSIGEPIDGKYRHRAYDAHSWPEVYFAGIGWVEFEPTSGDDELVRPDGPSPDDAEAALPDDPSPDREDLIPEEDLQDPRDPLDPTGEESQSEERGAQLGIVLAGVLSLIAASVVARFVWERPFAGLDAPSAMYLRVVRAASWLGWGPKTADTPFEFSRRVGNVVPEAREPLDTIAGAYVHAKFARAPEGSEPAALSRAWAVARRSFLRFVAATSIARVTPGRLRRAKRGGPDAGLPADTTSSVLPKR